MKRGAYTFNNQHVLSSNTLNIILSDEFFTFAFSFAPRWIKCNNWHQEHCNNPMYTNCNGAVKGKKESCFHFIGVFLLYICEKLSESRKKNGEMAI